MEPLRNKVVRAVAPVLDGLLMLGMITGVWALLVRSPLCTAGDPQWARERNLIAGGVAAGAYVLLTAAAGLYRAGCRVARAQIPLVNLGTCALVLGFGWLAVARYAGWSEGAVLLPRRVLLFGIAGGYVLTTLHHYARLGITAAHAHHGKESA